MSHTRWTEVEARAALRAARASGLSLHAFAKRQGWAAQRLYSWRDRLGEEEEVELLSVEVARPRGEPVLVLHRSGHMLKVGRGFDEEAFARAVQVLDQC